MAETYTLGYSDRALDFVSLRTLESHGGFFIPYLRPGMAVLDCGCGPGSITLGIAARIGDGTVVGVDMNEAQIKLATEAAAARALVNVSFLQGSAYALKFPDASFDAVFSHALLEHLSDPGKALREFLRVLRPGGVAGVCAPDWGGFLCSPYTEDLAAAMRAHNEIQNRNGGDTLVGRKLLGSMQKAGYVEVKAQARYQNYEDLSDIAGALAVQLEHGGSSNTPTSCVRGRPVPSACLPRPGCPRSAAGLVEGAAQARSIAVTCPGVPRRNGTNTSRAADRPTMIRSGLGVGCAAGGFGAP